MRPFSIIYILIFCITQISCSKEKMDMHTENGCVIDTAQIKNSIETVIQQNSLSIQSYPNPTEVPRSVNEYGETVFNTFDRGIHWTVGFYPGSLWLLFDLSGDSTWEKRAQIWTAPLEKIKNYTYTHDLGFMMFCSFGNGFRLKQNDDYKHILLQSAKSLRHRYDESVKAVKSHDYAGYKFPVIIDNMMNLELLFWATKISGDSSYYFAAKNHAHTTLHNHFRENMSAYQYVDFDSESGVVIKKGNTQGYNDQSEWARGQAWALYGFTTCYRETGDVVFLDAAEKIAIYLLEQSSMKHTIIPKWDLTVPNIENEPYDASAGAIICSALFDLHSLSNQNQEYYKNHALQILSCLSSDQFLADVGTNNFFLLKHSVGSYPLNENVDSPIVYADYYFLESLVKFHNTKGR